VVADAVEEGDIRVTIFLYNSSASSSVVSAPTLLSMISPYWLRQRYVGIASLDLDGRRKESVFVNSLLRAPGKRTLCAVRPVLGEQQQQHTSQHWQSKLHLGTAMAFSQPLRHSKWKTVFVVAAASQNSGTTFWCTNYMSAAACGFDDSGRTLSLLVPRPSGFPRFLKPSGSRHRQG
jgi:hypothetical protein